MFSKPLRFLALAAGTLLLAGCTKFPVLFPSGAVATHQRNLIVVTVILMLIVVIPLFVALLWVGIRYRVGNKEKVTYAPIWDRSPTLELLIWGVPLAIVVAIGAMTWVATHTLNPYRPLPTSDYSTAANAQPATKPLEIDVVALDWQWLFFYPKYGVASINQAAAPVNVPVEFRITAWDVMNSFYIPALAGQIYAMPGMRTKMNAVVNKPGNYRGISSNFSGAGFPHMHFHFLGTTKAGFKQWIAKAKASDQSLGRQNYLKLAQPTTNAPVSYYGHYSPKLFYAIVNRCVKPGTLCKSKIREIDRHGGRQLDSHSAHESATRQSATATAPARENG